MVKNIGMAPSFRTMDLMVLRESKNLDIVSSLFDMSKMTSSYLVPLSLCVRSQIPAEIYMCIFSPKLSSPWCIIISSLTSSSIDSMQPPGLTQLSQILEPKKFAFNALTLLSPISAFIVGVRKIILSERVKIEDK